MKGKLGENCLPSVYSQDRRKSQQYWCNIIKTHAYIYIYIYIHLKTIIYDVTCAESCTVFNGYALPSIFNSPASWYYCGGQKGRFDTTAPLMVYWGKERYSIYNVPIAFVWQRKKQFWMDIVAHRVFLKQVHHVRRLDLNMLKCAGGWMLSFPGKEHQSHCLTDHWYSPTMRCLYTAAWYM